MDLADTDTIHIFGFLLHSHLLGIAMRARVVRGDTELQPLGEQLHYDFTYQDVRNLKTPYVLKKVSSNVP